MQLTAEQFALVHDRADLLVRVAAADPDKGTDMKLVDEAIADLDSATAQALATQLLAIHLTTSAVFQSIAVSPKKDLMRQGAAGILASSLAQIITKLFLTYPEITDSAAAMRRAVFGLNLVREEAVRSVGGPKIILPGEEHEGH